MRKPIVHIVHIDIFVFLTLCGIAQQTENPRVAWNGYTQLRFSSNFNDVNSFAMRRMKLWVNSAPGFNKHWGFHVQTTISSNQDEKFLLQDVQAYYKQEQFRVNMGQFIPQFSLQRFQPDFEIPLTERSNVINAQWVIWLAVGSIAVNGLSVLFIRKDAKGNMNIKSAMLHLFSDLMTSVTVLLGVLAMEHLQWYWVDALFSVLIAIYLLYISWKILKSSFKIIMQFTPDDIDVNAVVADINKIQGIENMHHVHLWQIDEHDYMLEAHVDMKKDIAISEFEEILAKIKQVLDGRNIHHATIQPEISVIDSKQIIY